MIHKKKRKEKLAKSKTEDIDGERLLTVLCYLMQRSDGGGTFQAVDTMNGELLCGSRDVRACLVSYSLSHIFKGYIYTCN